MTIYEYFRFKSAEDIQKDLSKSGKWQNWRSFPDYRKGFLDLFGLTDDSRVVKYDLHRGGHCADLTVEFCIPTGLEIGDIHYSVLYYISGYKTPEVTFQKSIGGTMDFKFGNKYVVEKDGKKIQLYIRPRGHRFCEDLSNKEGIDKRIASVENTVSILNDSAKKVYESIKDGSYEQTCKKLGIDFNVDMYMQSKFPNFQSLTWLIMKTKQILDYDLSVEDAILMSVFAEKTVNTLHTYKTAQMEKHMKMIQFVWSWEQFADADEDDPVPSNADDLKEIINEIKFAMVDTANELNEYLDALINADRYVAVKLAQIIEEASDMYGINKKYVIAINCPESDLENRLNYIRQRNNEFPEDWRLQ